MKVVQLAQIAALEAFVSFDLLLELEAERAQRVHRTFDLLALEAHAGELGGVRLVARLLFLEALDGFLVLGLVADHGEPPIFTIPLGRPSRRESRNADGNSSSLPN